MIIDFHTHIFPEKIASKTIAHLASKSGNIPSSDGTADGLLSEMERAGVDISVTLPVMTSPTQFESINRYAKQINDDFANKSRRLISFAGIHPLCDDIEGKMDLIRKEGFLGIKIHPDYQGCYINHEGYIKILECAARLGLIVVTHSGADDGFKDMPTRCTPDLVLEVLQRVPSVKLVLAHLGANRMWDEVLKKLCGKDVYFDTACSVRSVDADLFCKIVEKHGPEHILFATDCPWSDMKKDVEALRAFGLDKEAEEKILYANAKRLLCGKD